MTHDRRFTTQKIGKRIKLVERMIFRDRLPFAPFRITRLTSAEAEPPLGADASGWEVIPWDSYWGGQNLNYLMVSEITIPRGWTSGKIALHLPMGEAGDIFTHPESLLYIDGVPYASADRYHHTIYLPQDLADGHPHRIELHGWTGLSGWPPDPTDQSKLFMKPCAVVSIDLATRDFLSRAEVALDVARKLSDDRPEKHRILNALDAAFLQLDTRDPLGDAFYRSIPRAAEALEVGLARAGQPMDVTLHAIGHAHMDIAYLWPISQIRRKNARTYSNVLRLMERFPDYTFSHSQPQLYDYTAQDYPEIFDGIRARVAEGRWEVMGGMWVECDTNIPGGEALVRQLLLGRRYFRDTFGEVETPVLWLPDTFGLSWCLPQLIKQAGLKWMLTNKASWNQYNQIPASTTMWQGIDGTEVLTHSLTTPRSVQHLPFPTNYKSDLSGEEVIGTWQSSTVKERISDLPICYGYGDGGGGPTGQLIRRAEAWQGMPGVPKLEFSTVRAFFEAIEGEAPHLATWADEMYLEGHRGVLTSQGWIKRANRKAEIAAHDAEFLAARAGGAVARDALTEAWKLICLNQFHDILPGTSITEVFDDARKDYARIDALLAEVHPLNGGTALANTIPFAKTRTVTLPHDTMVDGVTQNAEDGILIQQTLPPYSVSDPAPETPQAGLSIAQDATGTVMENALIRLEFSADADLIRIYDKTAQREVLKPGEAGNRLQVFEDRPISWDAWDIDAFFEDRGEVITGLTRCEIVESGPLRVALRIERSYRNSRVAQVIRLTPHSKRIDFVTEVDWHETHLLLKVAFPVQVFSPNATYEIQWGSIERPTHRNTLWDYAKFEVPAHRWADLSEEGYGVALLNDCKYGYDIREDVMRLSLIKSATMPDPVADQGRHVFTYALLPHEGCWRGDVLAEAYELNMPPRLIGGTGDGRALVAALEPNVVVETVKPAEDGDGLIVRLFEAHRRRGPVTIRFADAPRSVQPVNLLEEDAGAPLPSDGPDVTLPLTPFQIVSLRVRF
ncbi:alpha-mannosidase [Rubricella aquisinus]|uniref:Alpha-mannosidase n=1 Tax=Rubricella aquisinus TaxID=2028108 RepID=A0A840WWT3_9RHOB|nr:glycoside hydrolase family 38 C-terminal domain-containing protein [Rubricella aquisinus]MBB5514166.1 alpha-mannosidase [Rubricella aquisinus]